jgi:hypothetical protein
MSGKFRTQLARLPEITNGKLPGALLLRRLMVVQGKIGI